MNTTYCYRIRIRTTDGVLWLDEERWTADRSRATCYPTSESARRMAHWFLYDLPGQLGQGSSPKLIGWGLHAEPGGGTKFRRDRITGRQGGTEGT